MYIKECKSTIERNYSLLKTLLNIIPEPILTTEEYILKRLSAVNISLLESL